MKRLICVGVEWLRFWWNLKVVEVGSKHIKGSTERMLIYYDTDTQTHK